MDVSQVAKLASAAGLELAAVTSVAPLLQSESALKRWLDSGHYADMQYLARAGTSRIDSLRVLPSAQSIISVLFPYSRSDAGPCPEGYGRVARYAWGRDYHGVLPGRLKRFVAMAEERLGRSIESRCVSDSTMLLERAIAQRSGLGFIGKNCLLIHPGCGSFAVLGEVLWDVAIEADSVAGVDPPAPGQDPCGGCQSCLGACPTKALGSARQLNAGRCISYLTIEKRGALPTEARAWLGNWLFGCDLCQEACPWNGSAVDTAAFSCMSELAPAEGVGPFLSLAEIMGLYRDEQFKQRFAGTALLRPGREGLLRNAAYVAANTKAVQVLPSLCTAFHEDASALVRGSALWAIWHLAHRAGGLQRSALDRIMDQALKDPEAQIREEALSLKRQG